MSDAPVTTQDLAANAAAASLKAFKAIAASDFAKAAEAWIGSTQIAAAASSIWNAAALNNAALGHLLRGDRRTASLLLEQAAAACRKHSPPGSFRSTSSGFHVRLAARNLASFEMASARRARERAELLQAQVEFHARLAAEEGANGSTALSPTVTMWANDANCSAMLLASVTLHDIRQSYASKATRLEQAIRYAQQPLSLELIPLMTGLVTPALLKAVAASTPNTETIDGD